MAFPRQLPHIIPGKLGSSKINYMVPIISGKISKQHFKVRERVHLKAYVQTGYRWKNQIRQASEQPRDDTAVYQKILKTTGVNFAFTKKKVLDDNEDLLLVITACFEALQMINMITFSHFDLQFRDILNYHEFFIFHLIFILNLTCSDQLSWKCPCPLLTAFFFFATLFENCKLTYAYPNAIETCLIPNYFFFWKTVIISL